MSLAVQAQAGTGPAALQGVVRDSRGVAQIGALVQVLAPNSITRATAFTDLHGRYVIANLLPGLYQVRASAALYMPAVRRNLELRTGTYTVVNLTLATLYESAAWLPGERRSLDDSQDDWKWTLRSPVNRPMLRVFDEGLENAADPITTQGETKPRVRNNTRAVVATRYNSGQFGLSGPRSTMTVDEVLSEGTTVLMRAGLAADSGRLSQLTAGLQQNRGLGTTRMVAGYSSHPELGGLTVLSLRTAQKLILSDQIHVEMGGDLRTLHDGSYVVQAQPFVRITGRTDNGWTVQYRMATSSELQGFDDLDNVGENVPVAVNLGGHLLLQDGRHQEFTVARAGEHGSVHLSVYHDAINRPGITGIGLPDPVDGLSIDRSSKLFRVMGAGYAATGTYMEVNTALTQHMEGAIEYMTGEALSTPESSMGTLSVAVVGMRPRNAQALSIAVRGRMGATRIRASYRWQTARTVNAVNPYGDGSNKAFLSLAVRQPLHWSDHLPPGVEATVDVTNLLAQGYRPFLSEDGQTLYFAQAPRALQAGLSFTF